MRAIFWLLILVLAAVGVCAIVDYFGFYDIPHVEVTKQTVETVEALFN